MAGTNRRMPAAFSAADASARSTDLAFNPAWAAALDRATDALGRQQRDDGSWAGRLSSSALATAMSIVALHIVDRAAYREPIARGRDWLIMTQANDGGWGDAVVDASNINATSLGLGSLTLARHGENEAAPAIERASACLEDRFGGLEAVGDPRRCTLSGPCRTVAALAGLMDWRRIKRLRPEIGLLPARLRRTISTTFPAYLSIATLHAARAPHPLNWSPTYSVATRRAVAWLARAQGPNGSFEESAFLTSVILACLTAAGRGDLPWLRAALTFVLDGQRADGSWPIDRDLETFDTDLAVLAFNETGTEVPGGDRVRAWLLARQCQEACFPTSAPAGGWAWAAPGGWPDADDTAYTLLALRRLGEPETSGAIQRGSDWLSRLQGRDGAWSTFVRGSRMPFDHDCPYITAHALSALHACGRLTSEPAMLSRALTYLGRAQRVDGSFASIWFREATVGTAAVLEALADVGLSATSLAGAARRSLLAGQNRDGGWGGRRGQASTAEETAWAVLGLLRGPVAPAEQAAAGRGLDWLTTEQQVDGTWRATPIGLYYSAMWYSDSQYALALPMRALGLGRRAYA